MFYDVLIQVSKDILLIGGALSMVLLFFILVVILVLLFRVNNAIDQLGEAIDRIRQTLSIPVMLLKGFFEKKSKTKKTHRRHNDEE